MKNILLIVLLIFSIKKFSKINERILFFDMNKSFNEDSIEEDIVNVSDHFIKLFEECISNTLIRNLEANVNDVMGECLGEGNIIIVRLFKTLTIHAFNIMDKKLKNTLKNTCKDVKNECSYYFKFVDFCIHKNYNIKDSLENNKKYLTSKINLNLFEEIIKKSKDILVDCENLRIKLYKKRKKLMLFIQDQYAQKEEIAKTFKQELLPENQILYNNKFNQQTRRLWRMKLQQVFKSNNNKDNY